MVLGPGGGVIQNQNRRIGIRGQRDGQGTGHGVGGAAGALGGGGADGQLKIHVAVGDRGDGQPLQVFRGQVPGAVTVVHAGGEGRPVGNTGDGDAETLGAIQIGQSGGDVQGDRLILGPGGVGGLQGRCLGGGVRTPAAASGVRRLTLIIGIVRGAGGLRHRLGNRLRSGGAAPAAAPGVRGLSLIVGIVRGGRGRGGRGFGKRGNRRVGAGGLKIVLGGLAV